MDRSKILVVEDEPTIAQAVAAWLAAEGPGIPAAERGRVFERFSRGTRSVDEGTGLGLAIAQWVVDLHGGEIGVVDAVRGCRIRVLIPGGTG